MTSKAIKVVENTCLNNEVTIEKLEKNLKGIEEELEAVGDNMKQLEKSAEKALEKEEKLVEKIYNLQGKCNITEAKFEYGEVNITKLNQRIDDIEDEIYRERAELAEKNLKAKTYRLAIVFNESR